MTEMTNVSETLGPDVVESFLPVEPLETFHADAVFARVEFAYTDKSAKQAQAAATKGRKTAAWRRWHAACIAVLTKADDADIDAIALRLKTTPPTDTDTAAMRAGECLPHFESWLSDPEPFDPSKAPEAKSVERGLWDGAIGSGSIRAAARSVADYVEYRTSPKKKAPFFDVGNAVDIELLTPDHRYTVHVVAGAETRGSPAYKHALQTAEPGHIYLTLPEDAQVRCITRAIQANSVAIDLIRQADTQVELGWEYEIPGADSLLAYGRLDGWIASDRIIFDLKTDRNGAAKTALKKRIGQFAMQQAWYDIGLEACRGVTAERHLIILASSAKPYLCEVYEIGRATIERAKERIATGIERLIAARLKEPLWAGYSADVWSPGSPTITTMEAPPWAWE